jgi:ABC-type uncharacterized transport system auxiliary subunit
MMKKIPSKFIKKRTLQKIHSKRINHGLFQPALWLMILGGILFGCSGLYTAPKPISRYTISYASASPLKSIENRLPAIIKIERFGSAPGFANLQMIYAANHLKRNSYVYHQWFSPPSEMVAYALKKDLKASRAFTAITSPGDRISASHVLMGSVTDFYEKDEGATWQAVFGVSILFFSETSLNFQKQILLQKQYATQVTCQEKNAFAFAKAMSAAVQSISNQIILDIYETIAGQADPK